MPAMRYVVNRFREDGVFPAPSRDPIRAFHRSLPGYALTPLVRRPALARALGVADLYIKYEGTRYGLQAFKGLGASWALHRLLETRRGSFTTVAAASEGNHGRAVAWAARRMNVPCVIFLPARVAPERIENIRGEGATIVLVDGNYEAAVRQCDAESNRQGWQIISDVGYEGYLEIPPPSSAQVRWPGVASGQSTDAMLLATAVAHGCRLVTFDAAIRIGHVTGARREHLVILRRA